MGRTAFATAPRKPWLVVDLSAMDCAVADRDGVVPRSPPRLPSRLSKMLLGDRVRVALLDL